MGRGIDRRLRMYRDDAQLWLPLLNVIAGQDNSEASIAQVVEAVPHEFLANEIGQMPETEQSWDLDEIFALHEYLLLRSMRALNDSRTTLATVVDILDWVFSPELLTPEETVRHPFTFQTCLLACGVEDADRVREAVRQQVLKNPALAPVYERLFADRESRQSAA